MKIKPFVKTYKAMKTNILFAIALFAFSFTSVKAASLEDPKETAKTSYAINVFKGQEGKVNFLLEKVKGKRLAVTLRNAKGEILFTETIAKNATGYARRFDLNSLTDGKYSFEVTDGETTLKKEVDLSTDQPTRMVFVK